VTIKESKEDALITKFEGLVCMVWQDGHKWGNELVETAGKPISNYQGKVFTSVTEVVCRLMCARMQSLRRLC
jgi:hypothetical protein